MFSLELMSEQDFARAFTAERLALIQQYCHIFEEWRPEDELHWAIDKELNVTFLRLPLCGPFFGHRFLLTFEGLAMVIFMTMDDSIPRFDIPQVLQPRIIEIRDAILDAFKVHSTYGQPGPRSAIDLVPPTFE